MRYSINLSSTLKAISDDVKTQSGQLGQIDRLASRGGAHQGRLIGKVLAVMMLTAKPVLVQRDIDVESHRHFVILALALKEHELHTGSFHPCHPHESVSSEHVV